MKISSASMKTPGRTTPESVGNVAETTTINEHPQIGTLILTLQELSTEFPDSDGDDLCCNYNELMFSKDIMAVIGKSRRANLVKTLLEFLHISFKGSGHSYTIYFPRDLTSRCAQANEIYPNGLPIVAPVADEKLQQSPHKDSYSSQWVRSVYKAAGLEAVSDEVKAIYNRKGWNPALRTACFAKFFTSMCVIAGSMDVFIGGNVRSQEDVTNAAIVRSIYKFIYTYIPMRRRVTSSAAATAAETTQSGSSGDKRRPVTAA